MSIQVFAVDYLDRVERDQANHGAEAKFIEVSIREAKNIVEEAVLLIPKLVVAAAHFLHGSTDVDEVLKELGRQQLVGAIEVGQFERGAHQVEAKEAHPAGGVGLFENSTSGKGRVG